MKFSAFVFLGVLGALVVPFSLSGAEPLKNEKLPPNLAGNEDVQQYIEKFPGRGAVGDPNSKPLSVAESLKTFTLPDDLVIETVLAEPIVAQPLHISFDERSRAGGERIKGHSRSINQRSIDAPTEGRPIPTASTPQSYQPTKP